MKKFEFLPHTADFRIRVYGKNFNSLLNNSLLALKSFWRPKLTKKKKKMKLSLKNSNLKELILDFLSQIVAQTYIEKTIFLKFKGKLLKNEEIRGEVEGYKFSSLEKDIKAVTYHQAKLDFKNKTYIFEFIIDI